jgi:hypothetical protein
MNPRDQAEAGDGDPTKTVQLDDTYRVRIERGSDCRDSEQAALPRMRIHVSSTEMLPLEDRYRQADSALASALTEFKAAAAAVIDRIKAGESLPKPELDREWKARLQVIKARRLVERLERRRQAFPPQ